MLRYEKIRFVKDVPIFALYVVKYFYINKEVERSIFGRILESSKNDPKNVGICPGTLISHLGIIRTPKIQYNTIKKPEKPNDRPN